MRSLLLGELDAAAGGAGAVPLPRPRPFGDVDTAGNFSPGRANLRFDDLVQGRAEADADSRSAAFLRDNPRADYVAYDGRTTGGDTVSGAYTRHTMERDEARLRTGEANGYDGSLSRSESGAIVREHSDPFTGGAAPTPQSLIDQDFRALGPSPQERIDRGFDAFQGGGAAPTTGGDGAGLTRGLGRAEGAADGSADGLSGFGNATPQERIDGSFSNLGEATAQQRVDDSFGSLGGTAQGAEQSYGQGYDQPYDQGSQQSSMLGAHQENQQGYQPDYQQEYQPEYQQGATTYEPTYTQPETTSYQPDTETYEQTTQSSTTESSYEEPSYSSSETNTSNDATSEGAYEP